MTTTKLLYRESALTDKVLRRKDDTATNDPDWQTDQVDPGAFYAAVGAAPEAGPLTMTITPVDPRDPTPDPVVFTVTTETQAQAAEGFYDALVDDLASTAGVPNNTHLALYISRAEYVAAATSVQVVPNPYAKRFTVALTGTGGMTFTITPDDIFPITAFSAKMASNAQKTTPRDLVVSVYAVTSANDNVAKGTCTFTLEILRAVERYNPVTNELLRPGVADVGENSGITLSSVTPGEEIRLPMGGGRFGVRIHTVANLPAAADALEVRWRDVT